jgi:hypothetical protein
VERERSKLTPREIARGMSNSFSFAICSKVESDSDGWE